MMAIVVYKESRFERIISERDFFSLRCWLITLFLLFSVCDLSCRIIQFIGMMSYKSELDQIQTFASCQYAGTNSPRLSA